MNITDKESIILLKMFKAEMELVQEYTIISRIENQIIALESRAKQMTIEEIKDMYKECLEKFVPENKWDDVQKYLSTHGCGLAKAMAEKEVK